LFETADERGCTPMFGAAHRRGSACIGGSLPSAVWGLLAINSEWASYRREKEKRRKRITRRRPMQLAFAAAGW